MAKLIIWSGSNPLRIKNAIGKTLWNCGVKYVTKGMTGKIPQMEPGDVVLAMGQKTLDIVQNAGMVAKNRKIGSMRGKEVKLHSGKCTIIFTFDPGLIEIDSGRKPDIEWDTKLAIRKAKTGTLEPEIGKYNYACHFLREINYINKMYASTGNKVDICLDLETVGLDPFAEGVFIVSISITVKEGRSAVIRFSSAEDLTQPAIIKTDVEIPHNERVNKDLLHQIEWLVSTDKASMKGANLKFDMNWMNRHWGISDYSNYKMDTTIVGSLLDENRSNSLNNHAKTYTDMGGYDDKFNENQDKSRMDLVSNSDLLPYAGGDTDACLRVSSSLRRSLSKDKALRNFYVNLLHPASKAVQIMEQRGMVVDVAQYEVLRHKVQAEIDRTSKAFLKSVPIKIKIKYRDNLSPTRAALLNDYLFTKKGLNLKPLLKTAKSGKPSTAMEHMEMLEVEYPKQMKGVIDLLRDYNSATKTMSTYIVGFLKHLRTDGKFHPTYMLHKGDYGDAGDAGTVCVTKDTLFLTDKGQITTLNVSVGQQIISHTGLRRWVVDFIDNGIQDILKVTTESGLSLKTNKVHPYRLTNGAWVKAGDLNIGDEVVTYGACEKWRPVPEWPYEVSNWGRVRSLRYGICKAHKKNKWGHLKVSLARGDSKRLTGNKKDFSVHQIVAMSWLSGKKEGLVLRHLNGIAWDNAEWNLCWGTQLENKADDIKYGTSSKVNSSQAKLNWNKVNYIRSSILSVADLALEFGVSRRLVSDVINKKRWISTKTEQKRVKFSKSVITSIQALDNENTYGITVSGDCSHITNGIVTHNTGRTSAKDPAYQTIPKHTIWAMPLRTVYVPPPGMVILNIDYSQGELRIMACLSNEDNMLNAYRKGIDMHLVTGASVYGLDFAEALAMKKAVNPKIKEIRQGGKAGNFGLIYGISPEGFQVYARKTYGVHLSLDDSKRFKDIFFDKNPNILVYHEDQHKFAHKHGFVRSPLGRVRHLPLINSRDRSVVSKQERQSINSPTQATLSDIGLYAIAELHRIYPELWVNGFTHDSITAYVPDDEIGLWAYRMATVMENLPLKQVFGWDHQINFPVDAEVGIHNMGELEEYEIPLTA